MKKTLLYVGIVLLVLIVAFSSCSNDTDTTNEPTPTIEVTQTVTPTPTTTPKHTPEPTPEPTAPLKATAIPTAKPTTVPTQAPQNDTEMVWVTTKGKKYHSHSGCSNMKSSYQTSKEDAINSGRSACSKCY